MKPDALESLLHYFEAHAFIDKPVKSLSSGQWQLMLMIASFLSDKELLLLDEPFQFLDSLNKERTSEQLHSIASSQRHHTDLDYTLRG